MDERKYTLPTLIVGWGLEQRAVNTEDNEQKVPGIHWDDFERRFNLRKTFSESEIDYYDETSGQRQPFNRSSSSLHLKLMEGSKKVRAEKKQNRYAGISDEYVPGLSDFDLSKFGVMKKPESPPEETLSSIHVKVEPIQIRQPSERINRNRINNEDINDIDNSFKVHDELFKIARSPEREGDRIVLSSLPKDFQSLSFSDRRKLLDDLIPTSLKEDPSYKDHVSKIIRRNTSNTSSPNISRRGSIVSRKSSSRLPVDPNTNQMGSTILNSWVLGKVINRGAFGIIRECRHCNNMPEVKCVKLVNIYKSQHHLMRLKRELLTWSYLTEKNKNEAKPYIIPLIDFKITTEYIFMQMPIYKLGSLYDKVKSWEASRVTLKNRIESVIKYIYGSAQSIQFVHKSGLYHGDIKLENFMLQNDIPLLCDFGMSDFVNKSTELSISSALLSKLEHQYQAVSNELNYLKHKSDYTPIGSAPNMSTLRMISSSTKMPISSGSTNALNLMIEPKLPDNLIGSLPYAAPELLQPSPVGPNTQTDVWAFGIMCYALVMFKLPFFHAFEPRLKVMIMEGQWQTEEWSDAIDYIKSSNPLVHELCMVIDDIVSGCLQLGDRITMDQVITKLDDIINSSD